MTTRRFSWSFLVVTTIPVVASLLGTIWFTTARFRAALDNDAAQWAATSADALARLVQPRWPECGEDVRSLADALTRARGRVAILDGSGRSILHVPESTARERPPLTPTEITHVLATGSFDRVEEFGDGARARSARRVAASAESPEAGIVLVELPTAETTLWTGPLRDTLLFAAAAAIGTIAWMLIFQLHRARVLHGRIAQAARSLSAGDAWSSPDGGDPRELEQLSRAVRNARQRMDAQVATIDRQRRTVEALVTQLREGVVVVGNDGRIVLMNPSALRLLNLMPPRDRRDFTGLAVERCVPQLELQQLLAAHEARPAPAAGSDAAGDQRETRVEIETAGGVVHLLARVTDIVLPGGDEAGTAPTSGRLLVLTDVTDLTRTIQMKTDFVANASHELRTPLSTIRAALETLHHLDVSNDPQAAARFVGVIDRQSARLEALANDLLDLSRVETGVARSQPRVVPLGELMTQIQLQFAEALRRKPVRLDIDIGACRKTHLVADVQLLRLVLDNVLDNAIKFSHPGATVRLSVRSDDGSIEFSVADQGCGISSEDQERVFERFYQVERARSGTSLERGTGLGLSIVRHAVQAMGGRVRLQSQLGVGTTVTIQVPQPGEDAPRPAPVR